MYKIKPSTEEEMVYEFLKMEINSDRYQEPIKDVLNQMNISQDIITNGGNILSDHENILRKEILRQFRGYRTKEIFENFPKDIQWVWAIFDPVDISKIIYIEYSYWNELSNYTGSPLEAAKTILSGKTIFDVPNDGFISGAEKLKTGHTFPPLICLTDENEQRFILLEGHGRMTSYGLVPHLFQDVSALLGCCDSKALDRWYGKMPDR